MQNAINHMNEDHKDAVILLAKYFGNVKTVNDAKITSIEGNNIEIIADNNIITIKTKEPITKANVKSSLIALVQEARANLKEDTSSKNSDNLIEEVYNFIKDFKSVILATIDKENNPYATYAPFAQYKGKNYIYISQVAEHYSNLINNPNLEVMFIEDEKTAKLIAARTRVRFKSTATLLPRDIPEFNDIMDVFEQKIGSTMKTIRNMNDFNLFEITFNSGRYVKGFGKAFFLDNNNGTFTINQITGKDLGRNNKMPHSLEISNK